MADKRVEIRNALLAAVEALALVPAGYVLRWTGCAETFNRERKFPSVAVGFPPPLEHRVLFRATGELPEASYSAVLRFGVYVSIAGEGESAAEDAADEILGGLETGLHGRELVTPNHGNFVVTLAEGEKGAETLLAADAKVRIIGQVYEVEALEDLPR